MARYPNWDEAPELWDRIKLGGATLPGTCEITGGSLGVREDIVEEDGGKTRVNTLNYQPAEVEVTISMWTQAHFDKFKEIVKLYRPRKDGERPVLEVLHPWLEIYGITALYIIDIKLPRKVRVGMYEAAISLREFWEEREAVQKGTVSPSSLDVPLGGGIPEGEDVGEFGSPASASTSPSAAEPPSESEPPPPPNVASGGGTGGGGGGGGGR